MKKQILSEEFTRMQKLAGINIDEIKVRSGQLKKREFNKEFEKDFPLLDYDFIVQFIENQGYEILNDYYDGGFDVEDEEGENYFIGMFDTYLSVMGSDDIIVKTINFD
jgi:hypothetical protein